MTRYGSRVAGIRWAMASSADLLSLEVPCDPYAPAIVRNALAEVHDGGWSLDDGRLVASELVSNAVRHSGCADQHRLQIEVSRREGRLLISVHDADIECGLSWLLARKRVAGPNPPSAPHQRCRCS